MLTNKRVVAPLLMMGAVFAVLVGVRTAHAAAANIYIAQSAVGSANGSSCGNAYAYTWFNSSSNWGSGSSQIGPGTTVHVCGTITVGANTEALVFHGGGASGNPITLYFESGAVLSSPEWPADGSGGAIDVGSNSYVTINGNGGTGGATEGVIQATSNGDSGAKCLSGSCTSHGDSNGIEVSDGATNLTVEGLTIADMYVTATGVPNGGGGSCIYVNGNIVNWTITGNTMHDMGWCLSFSYSAGNSSNLTISNNNIYNIDHGIALGGYPAGANISNVNVFGNYIHDYSNWDTPGDVWHHDGIHIWGYNDNGSDAISNVNIYDNKFGGNVGQNVTAHIFIEQNGGNTKNVKIYNNTLQDTGNGADNDGLLTTGVDSGYQIYNNTIIGTAGDTCVGLSSSPGNTFVNNIVSGCGVLQYITGSGAFAPGGLHNNVYAGCSGGGANCFAYPGGYTASLSSWQGYTGQDANSTDVTSANLSSTLMPQSGSAAIGAGANLTSLGISTLDSDIANVARPATGAWDVGAYEVSSGGGGSGGLPPPGPAAPVITSAGAVSATAGSSFSYQIGASNSPTSYGATGLPSGLSVNTTSGLISGAPSTSGTYSVTLSASNSGGTGNGTLTLTVSAAAPSTYTLTVTKSGTGSGTVSGGSISCGSTCTASVSAGTAVTLSETPASGSTFVGWGGSCSGTGSCSVTMSAAKSVTASFSASAPTTDTTAPSVPSGLSASAASASQINLSWSASTDNVGVAGYKVYRNGSQIGTTANTSYSDTGLSASTKYTYTIAAYDAAGNVSAQSSGVSATTQAAQTTTPTSTPSGSGSCSTIGSGWTVIPITAQSGTFTISFDATPGGNDIDSVMGLSTNQASTFTDMAAIVRFNSSGDVDAIDSSDYAAASAYAYQGGVTYHFTMTVNPSAGTYSATVKSPTGATTTIALNYPFRDTQTGVSSFAYVDAHNDAGSTSLCNVSLASGSAGSGSGTPPQNPTSTPSNPSSPDTTPPISSFSNLTNGETISGLATVSVLALDNTGVAHVDLYVNGTFEGSDTASPYNFTVDTTGFADGTYTITEKSYDAAGNVDTENVSVNIANGNSGTPAAPSNPGDNGSGDNGNGTSTVSGLQAEIASLLAEIQQLEAQLAAQQGGGSASSTGSGTGNGHYGFFRNLFYGMSGADVTALQQFLINAGSGGAAQKLRSDGTTGYFGGDTQAALAEYQQDNGITPSNGYFGPKTRGYVEGQSQSQSGQ